MNNFRTLLLIPVFIFQISGILTNMNWGSMLLAELSGKVCQNIKHETSSKIAEPIKELITKKRVDLPLKKDSVENNRTIKRVSAITNILFSDTGNAALF